MTQIGAGPVPVEDWGKDHWSLLAYVYLMAVDQRPLDHQRMRCNAETHPLLYQLRCEPRWEASYGTRLRGYFGAVGAHNPSRRLPQHDDWDCLDDLEAAGYVEVLSLVNGIVRVTVAGVAMASMVLAHKAAGGVFATFIPPGDTE